MEIFLQLNLGGFKNGNKRAINCDHCDYDEDQELLQLRTVHGEEILILTPHLGEIEHIQYDLCKHSKFRHKMYGIKMDRNISQSFDLYPVVVLRASPAIFICETRGKF